MSHVVSPFEVSSETLARSLKVRFVHLLSGIATRHSDTIDCSFQVDGQKVTVCISCAGLWALSEREGRRFSDQELAEIAATFLQRTLQGGYEPVGGELFVGDAELRALARELGFL